MSSLSVSNFSEEKPKMLIPPSSSSSKECSILNLRGGASSNKSTDSNAQATMETNNSVPSPQEPRRRWPGDDGEQDGDWPPILPCTPNVPFVPRRPVTRQTTSARKTAAGNNGVRSVDPDEERKRQIANAMEGVDLDEVFKQVSPPP